MPDYEKLYGYLFNCITDALAELEAGRAEAARAVLISAQMRAEEMYIEENGGERRRITHFTLTNTLVCDILP